MENRDVARLLGAISMEARLGIVGSLIAAGNTGLTQVEISEVTGINASALWQHLDYMTTVDLVRTKLDGFNKNFIINFDLLKALFNFLNENYLLGYFPDSVTGELTMPMTLE